MQIYISSECNDLSAREDSSWTEGVWRTSKKGCNEAETRKNKSQDKNRERSDQYLCFGLAHPQIWLFSLRRRGGLSELHATDLWEAARASASPPPKPGKDCRKWWWSWASRREDQTRKNTKTVSLECRIGRAGPMKAAKRPSGQAEGGSVQPQMAKKR
jgi:hypothetical protein